MNFAIGILKLLLEKILNEVFRIKEIFKAVQKLN